MSPIIGPEFDALSPLPVFILPLPLAYVETTPKLYQCGYYTWHIPIFSQAWWNSPDDCWLNGTVPSCYDLKMTWGGSGAAAARSLQAGRGQNQVRNWGHWVFFWILSSEKPWFHMGVSIVMGVALVIIQLSIGIFPTKTIQLWGGDLPLTTPPDMWGQPGTNHGLLMGIPYTYGFEPISCDMGHLFIMFYI